MLNKRGASTFKKRFSSKPLDAKTSPGKIFEDKLTEYVGKSNDKTEVEVRFGSEDIGLLQKVSEYFSERAGEPIKTESVVDIYDTYRVVKEQDREPYHEVKEKIHSVDLDYGFKLTLYSEKIANNPQGQQKKMTRSRERYSWALNPHLRADVTVVNGETLEVELEVMSSARNLRRLELAMFAKETYRTAMDVSRILAIFDNFTLAEKGKIEARLSGVSETRPVNFKATSFATVINGGYFASYKANGVRSKLVKDGKMLWLKIHNKLFLLSRNMSPQASLIFDCESILDSAEGSLTVVIFDTMKQSFEATKESIKDKDLLSRIALIGPFIESVNGLIPNISFIEKEHIPVGSTNKFISAFKKIVSEHERGTKSDGVIFTPPGAYTSSNILKWKFPELLSVDVRMSTNGTAFVKDYNAHTRFREFRGTEDFPLGKSLQIKDYSRFEPMSILEINSSGEVIRVRADKLVPNQIAVAEDVWEDMQMPISEKMMSSHETVETFRVLAAIKPGSIVADNSLDYVSRLFRPLSLVAFSLTEKPKGGPATLQVVNLKGKKPKEIYDFVRERKAVFPEMQIATVGRIAQSKSMSSAISDIALHEDVPAFSIIVSKKKRS